MQETEFISKNKDKWQEFEQVLANKNRDPERLTDLFIETSDDLSYSRTYYSKRSVRVYLNGIAQQVYQAIYKNKRKEKNAFARFWKEELPDAMWYSRKQLLFSFLLFATGLFIGIFSSMYYPEFARIILGDGYIEMTEANIAKGDPMAVYKDSEPVEMFLRIALNNILIGFGTFVLGITFGIGTVYVILFNSIMVGAFIYFFVERNLFKESFLAIMLHGTLELSMIVIAGCAGFVLAKGLIFPGTYTRGQALIISTKNGIKILIGVAVLLFYAAFIESFATRHTDMPDFVRGGIIALSAVLVGGYFVWYPWRRNKLGLIPAIQPEEKPYAKPKNFSLKIIKSTGRIFTETFEIYSKSIRPVAIISVVAAGIITIFYGLITNGEYHEIYQTIDRYFRPFNIDWLWSWTAFDNHLNSDKYPSAIAFIAVCAAAYAYVHFRLANRFFNIHSGNNYFIQSINSVVIMAIGLSPLLLPALATNFILPVVLPVCLLWMYHSNQSGKLFTHSFGSTMSLLGGNFWKILGAFVSIMLIQWLALFIVSTDLADLLVKFIQMNIPRNAALSEQVGYIFSTWFLFFTGSMIFCLSVFNSALLFYSIKEKSEATSLLTEIEKIGFKKRVYGLEHEA